MSAPMVEAAIREKVRAAFFKAREKRLTFGYDPNEPRDADGKWTDGGGEAATMLDSIKKTGGVSYNPVTKSVPTSGYALSIYPQHTRLIDREVTVEDLQQYLTDRSKEFKSLEGAHIGVWYDAESGKSFLDVSHVEKDRAKAVELGVKHNQKAIWDIANGKEVNTGGTGEAFGAHPDSRRRYEAGATGHRRQDKRHAQAGRSFAEILSFSYDEALHPRDESGKWTVDSAVAGMVIKPIDARIGYKLAEVDMRKAEAAFKLNGGQYIGPGGTGNAIGNRYEKFKDFLGKGIPVEAPDVGIKQVSDASGNKQALLDFGNGRHRFAVLRDLGASSIKLAVSPETAHLISTLQADPKTFSYDEALHPRDEHGRWTDGSGTWNGTLAGGAVSATIPRYGSKAVAGAISATGIHYAAQPRAELDSSKFGTGTRSSESRRLADTTDARLRERVYFYVDDGNGVARESSVTVREAHAVRLTNLYDANADHLDLLGRATATANANFRIDRSNAFESAIIDAGFDGYVTKFGNGRAAVLLGKRAVPVKHVGYGNVAAPTGAKFSYDESLHPRDENGKWVSTDDGIELHINGERVSEAYIKYRPSEGVVTIDTLGVAPAHQGKGYGSRTLDAAVRESRARHPGVPVEISTTEPKLRRAVVKRGWGQPYPDEAPGVYRSAKFSYDESLHPRDENGKWAPSGFAGDKEAAKARIEALKIEIRSYATKGDLTKAESNVFKRKMAELESIRYDIGKPGTPEKVVDSPEVRKSTLSPETNAAISRDVWRSKDIYMPIMEAVAGVSFNADTPIDAIFNGKNAAVSAQAMYDNFAGTRAALAAQYGSEITLYRATTAQAPKLTTNWATTREFAGQFGPKVIEQKFPVSRVLSAYANANGKYHELVMGDPAQASVNFDWDETLHPRVEAGGPGGGQFAPAEGGGAGIPGGAAMGGVGGDSWNQATAARLKQQAEMGKARVDRIVKDAIANGSAAPTMVSNFQNWDELTQEMKSATWKYYKSERMDAVYAEELAHWREYDLANGIGEKLAEQASFAGDSPPDAWVEDAINTWRNDNPDVPFTNTQLSGALNIEFNRNDLAGSVTTVDRYRLIPPRESSSMYDAEPYSLTLPGFEAGGRSITREQADSLAAAVHERYLAEVGFKVDMLAQEPPSYLRDVAGSRIAIEWNDAGPLTQFKWAEKSMEIPILADAAGLPMLRMADGNFSIAEPSKYDPLEVHGDETQYKMTQSIAHFASIERSAELLVERKVVGSIESARSVVKGLDTIVWEAWKSSSTSPAGWAMQVAAARELGGRLNEYKSDNQVYTSAAAVKYADQALGGMETMQAIVRGKWETTQYLLEKAGVTQVELYRGIRFGKDAGSANDYLAAQKDALLVNVGGNDYKKLPTLTVARNGAQSATTDPKVANEWGFGTGRVVLRARVPASAVLSLPAYGVNVHSEHEVVITGTAWSGWDAWDKKAPTTQEAVIHSRAAK